MRQPKWNRRVRQNQTAQALDVAQREIEYDFLAGGGAMRKLIREHTWSATPLGPVETWPQSLRSADAGA